LKSQTCCRSTHLRFWQACWELVQGELDGRVCGPNGVGEGLPAGRDSSVIMTNSSGHDGRNGGAGDDDVWW
jgi:hypothetical protein